MAKRIMVQGWSTTIVSTGPAPDGQAFVTYQFQAPGYQSPQFLIAVEDGSAASLAKLEGLLVQIEAILGHSTHPTHQ